MKKEHLINIIYLSFIGIIPFVLMLFCAVNFDNNSEASILFLPLAILSYLGQVLVILLIGVLSKSFRINLFVGLLSFIMYSTALILFGLKSGLFVIKRLESGYIYGLHPWDDAHTFGILISIVLLILISVIMLIVKKSR